MSYRQAASLGFAHLPVDNPQIRHSGGKWSESSRFGSVPVRLASRLGRCAGRIVAPSLVPLPQPAVGAMRLVVRRVSRRSSFSFFRVTPSGGDAPYGPLWDTGTPVPQLSVNQWQNSIAG